MEYRAFNPDCDASSDYSLKRFAESHYAGQFSDYVLAIFSVGRRNGSSPKSKVTERRDSTPFTTGVVYGVKGPGNGDEEVDKAA